MSVARFTFRVSHWAVLALVLAGLGVAQETAKVAPALAAGEQLKQLVVRQFGSSFELLDFPPIFMDVDGDGIEDAVIVATSKNPLLDSAELRYKVVDPYDDYFGLGDPKITTGFTPSYLGPPRFLLIVHSWREAKPKAKFVIINLPFEKLSAGRVLRKKKPVPAINAEESSGLTSAVFWDGKKYKWEPSFMGQ